MPLSSSDYPRQAVTGSNQSNVAYLDVNLNYSIDQNQISLANANAIKVKIINVIYTSIGSRPFEPEFGSLVPTLIFSSVMPNGKTAYRIETAVYAALTRWMGNIINISIGNISVIPIPNQGAYFISISYSVNGLVRPQNLYFRYSQ